MFFDKAPAIGGATPPHQDAYFLRDVSAGIHLWIALDECDEKSGCLRYLPGSHRRPICEHTYLEHPIYTHAVEGYGPTQHVQEVACPVVAGDVIAHHIGVIHRAGANTSLHQRRAISVSYYQRAARGAGDGGVGRSR